MTAVAWLRYYPGLVAQLRRSGRRGDLPILTGRSNKLITATAPITQSTATAQVTGTVEVAVLGRSACPRVVAT